MSHKLRVILLVFKLDYKFPNVLIFFFIAFGA